MSAAAPIATAHELWVITMEPWAQPGEAAAAVASATPASLERQTVAGETKGLLCKLIGALG